MFVPLEELLAHPKQHNARTHEKAAWLAIGGAVLFAVVASAIMLVAIDAFVESTVQAAFDKLVRR